MMVDVIAVRVLENYHLWLKFEDGIEGEIDFAKSVGFDGVFAPLESPNYFALVQIDPDLGSVVWPNGADLDPLVLHAAITGHAVQVA
jgi:hypothetical protein